MREILAVFIWGIIFSGIVWSVDRPNNQEYKGIQINDIEFCKADDNKNLAIFVNDQVVYHLDCERKTDKRKDK